MAEESESIQNENDSFEERKKMIAHQMWEDEGQPEGQAERHWSQACLVIMTMTDEHENLNPEWLNLQEQNYVPKTTIEIQVPVAEVNFMPPKQTDAPAILSTLEELKNRVLKRAAA